MIPALFTSTSSGPSRSALASRKRAKESSSVTSSSKPAAVPESRSAAAAASSPSRSPIATECPRSASAWAVARPIPRAAPVIDTTFVIAGTLGSSPRRARCLLARGRRRVLLRPILDTRALEPDGAIGLEDRRADRLQRVVSLSLRDRAKLGLRDLLAPHRAVHELAVLDQIARRALEHPVGPRIAVRERLEREVDREQRERSDDRPGHRIVVADDPVLHRVRDEQKHEEVERVLLSKLALAEEAQDRQQEEVDDHGAKQLLANRDAHMEQHGRSVAFEPDAAGVGHAHGARGQEHVALGRQRAPDELPRAHAGPARRRRGARWW